MMTDNRKLCIFCEKPAKMTSEHIWGEWVQDYVEPTFNKHDFANIHVPRPGEDQLESLSIRAGDPLNAQVGVVCGDCNSGWMSVLQNHAKRYLIPLFGGTQTMLADPAQKAIAAWAAMATMTGEHIARRPDRLTIPQSERAWLRDNHTAPPEGWRIWLGRCHEPWAGRQWVRVTAAVLDTKEFPGTITAQDRIPNLQTTAFKIGKLYVATMNCAFPEITRGWDWRSAPRATDRLQQIWPVTNHFLTWPRADMTGKDAEIFATAFKRYSDDLARRVGYR